MKKCTDDSLSIGCHFYFQCLAAEKENKTKEATLNGLHLVLDANWKYTKDELHWGRNDNGLKTRSG